MAYKKGVPKGYKERWKYKLDLRERKIGKKNWVGGYIGIKTRPARTYGGFGKGSRFHWRWTKDQYAVKIGKGKYLLKAKFKKRLINSVVKRPKRRYNGRGRRRVRIRPLRRY